MKSMLYVGATLMIGASIYGFVDYKNSSRKKEFTGLYTDETGKTETPVKESGKKDLEVEKVMPVNKPGTGKSAIAKKTETLEDAVTGTTKEVKDDSKTGTRKPVRKRRRFSSDLFSRAPLRDEIEMPVIKEVKATDIKSSEKKEQ